MALFNAPGGTGSTGLPGPQGEQGIQGPPGTPAVVALAVYGSTGLIRVPLINGSIALTRYDGSTAAIAMQQ